MSGLLYRLIALPLLYRRPEVHLSLVPILHETALPAVGFKTLRNLLRVLAPLPSVLRLILKRLAIPVRTRAQDSRAETCLTLNQAMRRKR